LCKFTVYSLVITFVELTFLSFFGIVGG